VAKVIKCSPEVAERLTKRLLKKGLVVGIVKETETLPPWASRADVILIVKDEKERKH